MEATQQLVGRFVDVLLNPAIKVLFSIALLMFVWGTVQFLRDLNEGKDGKEGKMHMLYGVLGMFIMVSVFGIIALISNTFGLGVSVRGTYNPDMSRINNILTPRFGP